MLQIRRETDYAIRCVYYLAGKSGKVTMATEIGKAMDIPLSFVAKILQRLKKAGLVRSYQGVKGGFQLLRRPEDVNFYDVLVAIEGPVAMNMCTVKGKQCSLNGTCNIHPLWLDVRRDVEDILRKITIGSILKKHAPQKAGSGEAASPER